MVVHQEQVRHGPSSASRCRQSSGFHGQVDAVGNGRTDSGIDMSEVAFVYLLGSFVAHLVVVLAGQLATAGR